MKYLMCMVLVLVPMLTSAAGVTDIPVVFRGNWAAASDECDLNGPKVDLMLVVRKSDFYGYEYGCKIIKIKDVTKLWFKASVMCSGEGSTYKKEIKWSVFDGGKAMKTDSGNDEKYVRCPH